MQVKVFESPDIATGLKMVKDELGPDALILSTKTVHSGKLGLLGKKSFEITAALDSDWPDTNDTKQSTISGTYNRTLQVQEDTPKKPTSGNVLIKSENQPQIQSEVDELKGMIKNLGQEMTRMNNRQYSTQTSPSTNNTVLNSLQQRILDLGVSQQTAQTITGFAKESLTLDELSDPFAQQQYLSNTFEELFHVSKNIFNTNEDKKQHRLALVGPTGVGKTTSLAKIAANYLSNFSGSVGFITIDTYRIAAVEQLKVYGDIMDLPVEVVLSPEQFERALLKLRDKDLILIDTAGRSPKDSLCIDELAAYLRPDLSIDKHLVLSATTRENEIHEAMDRFSVLGIDHTLITKIDECSSLGILLDLQIRIKTPFSFIANGQRVPEDIMEATPQILSNLIMSPGEGSVYE
jgi:flagellar biosynthesis protein FlhF